ncbi:5910_t:CDS:2, partial [Acaulospora morrowiae]
MSVKYFIKDLPNGIDGRLLKNTIEETSSTFAASKYTKFHSKKSFYALEEGICASNLITESIFDFLIIAIIPVLLTVQVDKKLEENESFIKLLLFINTIVNLIIAGLKIWFWVRIYKATEDFFFMIYFIVELFISLVFLLVFSLVDDAFYPVIVNGTSIFTTNLVFLFLAVKKDYVDEETYLFVLVPV